MTMGDQEPAPDETHTVTIEVKKKAWTKQEWQQFKDEIKKLTTKYGGKVKALTFEKES